MRILLTALTITAMMASCNSKKSADKTPVNKDSMTKAPVDTAALMPKDSAIITEPHAIGDLSLDMTQAKVLEQLGKPESQSKAEEWGADGLIHQDWIYKTKGISLNMSGEKNKPQTVSSITITSPCTFKTPLNIGIGSSYKEVKVAYNKEIDTEASEKNTIVVGSIYGGIIFTFKNDKVENIFIGAAAE